MKIALTRSSYSSLVLLLALGVNCSKPREKAEAAPTATAVEAKTPAAMRIPLSLTLSDTELALADRLASNVEGDRWMFEEEALGDPKNAPVFAYLVATDARPEVVAAALRGLLHALSKAPAGSEEQPLSKSDLTLVLQDSVKSPHPRVQSRALDLAQTLLRREPGGPLVESILAALPGTSTAPAQYELLDTLAVLPPAQKRTALDRFVPLTSNLEPFVFARLLEELTAAWRSASPPPSLIDTAVGATRHADATVRGRATEFLGAVGRGLPQAEAAVLARFEDESPYVLAQAATASARMRVLPAAHSLVKLLDDDRADRIEGTTWKTPEGSTGRRMHGGPSSKSTVSQAAFQALAALSGGALKPEPPQPGEADGGHARNVKAAKAWYAKEKGSLPKADQLASTTASKPAPKGEGAPAPATTTP